MSKFLLNNNKKTMSLRQAQLRKLVRRNSFQKFA